MLLIILVLNASYNKENSNLIYGYEMLLRDIYHN